MVSKILWTFSPPLQNGVHFFEDVRLTESCQIRLIFWSFCKMIGTKFMQPRKKNLLRKIDLKIRYKFNFKNVFILKV